MCPVCNCGGSLQILNSNTLNTNRIRHYLRLDENRKPQFEYHKVSKQFVEKILADQNVKANADQTNSKPDQSIVQPDLNLQESSLKPGENYRFLRALEMRSKAFFIFSMELAKDKRR
jgi:hypothetical protein